MPRHRVGRRRGHLAAVTATTALALLAPLASAAPAALPAPEPTSALEGTDRVIVRAATAAVARAAMLAVGGHVRFDLPIVDGVAADVPVVAVAALARRSDVRTVTQDARMTVQGGVAPEDTIEASVAPRSVYPEVVRADRLAAKGWRGAGVTVALLDTGISGTPDLAGRVLPITDLAGTLQPCVNLSGEPTCADGYGHGTFLAGIIAGDGTASDGRYLGVAPGADLVSIKVGASDGSADVSNVLAGIQWAVSFRDRYDIRVLNLSLGTTSTQSWEVDPLNYAVERAWAEGIAVVVAASNRGPAPGTISKPGDDPYVITVGATDDLTTVRLGDDVLPDFSARGPAPEDVAKPDVAAPGGHIVSLRAIGSAIDEEFPNVIDGTYRQGSGTSMSAAVVSGVAAAIFSARPKVTPDRLKYMLAETARPVAVPEPEAVGRGMVDARAALRAPRGKANLGLTMGSGLGSLDESRGEVKVSLDDAGQTAVNGRLTAQNVLWDRGSFLLPWDEAAWYASNPYQLPWYRTSWYGYNWEGYNWEGCSWGATHDEECFYGYNWEGSTWYGAWD